MTTKDGIGLNFVLDALSNGERMQVAYIHNAIVTIESNTSHESPVDRQNTTKN